MTTALSHLTPAPPHRPGLGPRVAMVPIVALRSSSAEPHIAAHAIAAPRAENLARPLRIVFIGNALPRRCGIATFTTDLEAAVAALPGVLATTIIAMRDPGGDYAWPTVVRRSIEQNDPHDYRAAAEAINQGGFDIACLQHEFGIYGGEAGAFVLGLIAALKVPLVTTLHTVLDGPSIAQRRVMDAILSASARVIVMAGKGRDILINTYGADPAKIAIIVHGIPEVPLEGSQAAKQRLGYAGRQVILTFGLISPNKGIAMMIAAMPAILAAAPDAVYVVMGATHPHLLRAAGEAHRDSLIAQVAALGLQDHVVFLNRFVDRPELLEHIAMCDVYVTPYLDAAQLTSGTLAYSHGLGRAVVSTPYWHAEELLRDGSGVLVPFGDPAALSQAVIALLSDTPARLVMGARAYAASRPSVWASTAARYVACFRGVIGEDALRRTSARALGDRVSVAAPSPHTTRLASLPAPTHQHFLALCDDTGMFQHAIHTVPDRRHGYCVDDNARALILCCTPGNRLAKPVQDALTTRFAAFIEHAWNPDNRRFRNFMSFSREWLEPAGSQDSHGRTLWALGVAARAHRDGPLGPWAAHLFDEALPTTLAFTAPRSWAFTLLGLGLGSEPGRDDTHADASADIDRRDRRAATRHTLAHRLLGLLTATRTSDWVWFEARLAYDNARLCEALIRSGSAMADTAMVEAGLASLRWLTKMQTAPAGHFRPIGSQGFLLSSQTPAHFYQQPLEAAATIAACAAAHTVDPAGGWLAEARRAFAWFLGANDLGLLLVDCATGICRDGLHPDRVNQNSGAESVLAWLMALVDMRRLYAISAPSPVARSLDPIPA